MSLLPPDRIAMVYADDAFVELLRRAPDAPQRGPAGLMGRQVAGREFLDAYFTHGSWQELAALVYDQKSVESLTEYFKTHPAHHGKRRRLDLVDGRYFHRLFLPQPSATLLYIPSPIKVGFTWARQHGNVDGFALCGVTHTFCDAKMVQGLCEMLTAPYKPYDCLICTSRAVVATVRKIIDNYADFLRDTIGGNPTLRTRLELIPLGVNPDKFKPATPEERAAIRGTLNIADDEVVVLFVGRLAAHAKAHPFPMYDGLRAAAQQTGAKVHLLISGWGPDDVLQAYAAGAKAFAGNVRVTIVDGTKPEFRFKVWQAADIFTSPSDNIQETFGLVVIEAMACGLPVVASDWNGYRDLVVDGETGLLVPTYLVNDATPDLSSRLLGVAELDYDTFLAESNQTITVDPVASAQAYARLLADPQLRQRLGVAGRQRVLDQFSWERVIKAYEALWRSQEAERQAYVLQHAGGGKTYFGAALYPRLEHAYSVYPTRILDDADQVQSAPVEPQRLQKVLRQPVTNYADSGRVKNPEALQAVLTAAAQPISLAALDKVLEGYKANRARSRATIGWLLKYGLLQVAATP